MKKQLHSTDPTLPQWLQKAKTKNSMQVPEGYFDTLGDRIQQRIQTEEQTKIVPLYRKTIFKYVAAAAIVIITALYFVKFSTQPTVPEQKMSLNEYYITEFDEATLIDMALESNLKTSFTIDDSLFVLQLIDEEILFEQL